MRDGQLSAIEVVRGLGTRRVGRSVEVFDKIDSTNRHALERLDLAKADGLVVLAEQQTAGRGRLGREWHCPTGAGILCTVVLVDTEATIDGNLLSLLVPVAISDGILDATDVRTEIRWPNDLVVGPRKLAGVLIESGAEPAGGLRYAIGFGINCLQHHGHFPPDLRQQATSLDIEHSTPIDRGRVLRAVLRELDRWVAQPQEWNVEQVCELWKRHALPLGQRVRLRHLGRYFTGNILDIAPSAALVVQLDEGGRRLFPASSTTLIQQTD